MEAPFCLMHLWSLDLELWFEVKFGTQTEVTERTPPHLQNKNTPSPEAFSCGALALGNPEIRGLPEEHFLLFGFAIFQKM